MTSTLNDLIAGLAPESGILIDGAWLPGGAGHFEVVDPATAETITKVASADKDDARRAVDAAEAAFAGWAARSPRERSDILRRAFDRMKSDAESFAQIIALENGKSMADARAEVAYAAEFFRWYSEEAVRGDGSYSEPPAGGTRMVVTHKPVGVAALVTPWNFPAAMATRKIAPALAAGCTVVLKPAKETPLTALLIGRILSEAGVPPGVVNIVPTERSSDVVTTWLEDPRVRKISFTGSTEVGRILLRQSADRIVNASMELGGNAPFVVMADADIDAAVAGAMIAKFRNGGQACTAANCFWVHSTVVDEFTAKFGAAVEALTVGPAQVETNQIGPLINSGAVQSVNALVDDAVANGAMVTHQGRVPEGTNGYYVAPAVVRGVDPSSRLVRDEIFGPIAPIITWENEIELLQMVNDSELGLASYVYSKNLQNALRVGEAIDAGMVGVNRGIVSDPAAPFGGMKQSGLGREGAREGIRAFLETQYFSIDWS